MKQIILALIIVVTFAACKKTAPITEKAPQTVYIRVQATGSETTYSPIAIVKF